MECLETGLQHSTWVLARNSADSPRHNLDRHPAYRRIWLCTKLVTGRNNNYATASFPLKVKSPIYMHFRQHRHIPPHPPPSLSHWCTLRSVWTAVKEYHNFPQSQSSLHPSQGRSILPTSKMEKLRLWAMIWPTEGHKGNLWLTCTSNLDARCLIYCCNQKTSFSSGQAEEPKDS